MAPKKKGTDHAKALAARIVKMGEDMGLYSREGVPHGQTVWAADRKIKVVLTDKEGRQLGIDCFCQEGGGSAYLKYFAKELDVKEYQFKGIVVWKGAGFPKPFQGVLRSRGAVHIDDLPNYIRTHFSLKAAE